MTEVIYKPLENQKKFHNSTVKYRLFGGAMGWWKSQALRMEAIRQCLSATGITWVIFRRSHPELQDSIITPMRKELPLWIAEYKEGKKVLIFNNHSDDNKKSRLLFRHIQNDSDVYRYQGAEFDFIWIDELTHFSYSMFEFILWRLRTSKKWVKPNFFWTTNPWWIWHERVKRIWIDRDFRWTENPEDYAFIPSYVWDNPYITKNNPDYVKTLENMDETRKKAYLYWDWNVFAGQYFREFTKEIHTCEPTEIPNTDKPVACLDYWYTNPSAVYLLNKNYDDNVYISHEIYESELLYDELAKKIKEKIFPHTRDIVIDPALTKKSETTRESLKWVLEDYGFSVHLWNNDRLTGWQKIKQLLKDEKLKISNDCTELIRTIPLQQHDSKKVEDLDTNLEDHWLDAIRYWLMHIFGQQIKKKWRLKLWGQKREF